MKFARLLAGFLLVVAQAGSAQFLAPLWNPQPILIAPFNDLGSGAVNTTLARGAGVATFTRATTATTFGVTGTAPISVASGVARSYYDPVSHLYLGYLAEQQATNLLLNSTINGANLGTQTVTVSAQAYTLSFYGTGTVTLSGTAVGAKIGTGTYPTRSKFTFTPTAGGLTLTVSGTVQYAQLETGSVATSFIPTAGATVTRNADVLTYPTSGNILGTAGTAYAEFTTAISAGPFTEIIAAYDGANGGIPLRIQSNGKLGYYDGTNNILTGPTITLPATTAQKGASAWGGTSGQLALNGAVTSGLAFDGDLNLLASLAIGTRPSGGGPPFLNGTIKNVRIYPAANDASYLRSQTSAR